MAHGVSNNINFVYFLYFVEKRYVLNTTVTQKYGQILYSEHTMLL